MNILITGSSGQIGTNLGLKLIERGHQVFGIDKRPNTWTDAFPYILQDLSGQYREFEGGIGGVTYPDGIQAVVHLAANAKVHELVDHPDRALHNIQSTFNVLEYCRMQHLPIIFSSSREVYGDIFRYITNEEQSDFHFTESPYSASKIAGEALIYSYARCYDIPYLVFRFSNVYGKYDADIERMQRVIPLFIRKIRTNEPITIYGREKTLDFTYVDDCVNGVVLGVEKLVKGEVRNETINLAYGEGHTLVEMASLISTELGKTPEVSIEPSLVGEVTHYVANIEKARKLLGYEPTVKLEVGIKRAIQWQKEFYRNF